MQSTHFSVHLSTDSDIKWQTCGPQREDVILVSFDTSHQFITITLNNKKDVTKLYNVMTEIMEYYNKLELLNDSQGINS